MLEAFREIGRIFQQALQEALALFRDMWRALLGMLILLVVSGVAGGYAIGLVHTALGQVVAEMLVSIASFWLASPYFVAVYRYLLLGELIRWPEALRQTAPSRRFFAWSAALAFAATIPGIVEALFVRHDDVQAEEFLWIRALGGLVLLVLAIRCVTILPATALDRPTSLRLALTETRGRFWFILLAAMLPALAVAMPVAVVEGFVGRTFGPTGALVLGLPLTILSFCFLIVMGFSVTAQLYKKLAIVPPDEPDAIPPP